ncbi:MAG: HEPN domain-containing protein [Actinobacteria bacterium]|nr:HEPN domain-containing protein [Actinomycetota bacterium]
MSPRSEEFMAEARDRLAAARASLASGFPPAAVSLAYYAMLYAARAALSEENRYAKTHSGTWQLFGESFVNTERFERQLFSDARDTLELRLGADYEAKHVQRETAKAVVELATRFVSVIETLYPPESPS